ncbi:hypothetical protein Tco_1016066, partial [Tanacetum coccineum]
MRIIPSMTQKEPTYQVVLDALALSPLYPTFLITTEVPKIYMQQFWSTITKIKDSSLLPNQEFVEPPFSDEEIVSFIKELGYKGDIESVNEVYTDHMHQPWKNFSVVINRCRSGKTAGLDKTRLSRAQILWGMFYNKNVDFNSLAYKTYLAFATGATTLKKARKWKKPASPSKKKTPVIIKEHAKKLAAIKYCFTLGSQMKKAIKRSQHETHLHQAGGSGDGAGLEPEVPDEQKGKSINTYKGTGLKPGVPDVSKADSSESEYESWGVSDDDDDVQQGDDKRTESDDDKSVDLNKTDNEEETQEDEFVHTPEIYVPTDDETNDVDDEEYRKINEEMYDDVNVELKDTELADEGKDDEEMTDAEKVNAEHEEVIQEEASTKVQNEAQVTTTAAPAQVASWSRSVSSNYGSIFLNLDNISSVETEIISMLDVQVQHENPNIHSSSL